MGILRHVPLRSRLFILDMKTKLLSFFLIVSIFCNFGLLWKLKIKDSVFTPAPQDFAFNLENQSPQTLNATTFEFFHPDISTGSCALHASGLQSFALWIKVNTRNRDSLEIIAQQFMENRRKVYGEPFEYVKSDLHDDRIHGSGNTAPDWWDPQTVKNGYSFVTDRSRGGHILVDTDRLMVYALATD